MKKAEEDAEVLATRRQCTLLKPINSGKAHRKVHLYSSLFFSEGSVHLWKAYGSFRVRALQHGNCRASNLRSSPREPDANAPCHTPDMT